MDQRERERTEEFCVFVELPRHRGVGGPFAKDFSGRGRSGRIRLLLETGWIASIYAHTHTHTNQTYIHRSSKTFKNCWEASETWNCFYFLFSFFFVKIKYEIPFHFRLLCSCHERAPSSLNSKNKVNKHDTITEKAAQHVQLYTTTELDDVERTGGKEFGSSESNWNWEKKRLFTVG
jgi:hypothetical protein